MTMNVSPVPVSHGGDWAGFLAEYGTMPLDFSANVSPLGVPPEVQSAASQALASADRYPDPLCRDLCAAIAERERVRPDEVLCGNGASDLLYRMVLSLRPKRALLPVPTFTEYAAALTLCGAQTDRVVLLPEDDFVLSPSFVEALRPDTDLVILCNPNNPTGRTVPPALLRRIAEATRDNGTVLCVDECFVDFVDDPERVTLRASLSEFPNVILLRAFTKLYAIPGLRLGFALCGDPALLHRISRAGPPWSVSGPAQAAGLAALSATGYREQVRALIRSERPVLRSGLQELGLTVLPGEANFLLVRGTPNLGPELRRRGILLRACPDFEGLSAGWFRVAVRTPEENNRMLATLKEVLP